MTSAIIYATVETRAPQQTGRGAARGEREVRELAVLLTLMELKVATVWTISRADYVGRKAEEQNESSVCQLRTEI